MGVTALIIRNMVGRMMKEGIVYEDGFEEGEALLYRYFEEDDLPRIENIETEEEYEIAADGFDEWQDASEYDELFLEDDED